MAMTSHTAGRYRCFCRNGELWSEPSEPLDLCHRRPSHAQGSPRGVPAEFPVGPVTSAHTCTYRCFGAYTAMCGPFPSEPGAPGPDVGDPSLEPTDPAPDPVLEAPWYRTQGGLVTWKGDPGGRKVWEVRGEERVGAVLHPISGPSAPAPAAWDHTAQNLLRIGLAVLVLVALTWLLAEDWLCRWRTREGAGRAQAGMDCDVCAVPQSGVTCTDWGVGVK
nr:natural cytotoxicity triggering receptor 1-like [Oryctolagus cuniculus]